MSLSRETWWITVTTCCGALVTAAVGTSVAGSDVGRVVTGTAGVTGPVPDICVHPAKKIPKTTRSMTAMREYFIDGILSGRVNILFVHVLPEENQLPDEGKINLVRRAVMIVTPDPQVNGYGDLKSGYYEEIEYMHEKNLFTPGFQHQDLHSLAVTNNFFYWDRRVRNLVYSHNWNCHPQQKIVHFPRLLHPGGSLLSPRPAWC